ncbi:aminotransferase class I/II-fold pyridoxal phosphate-dependent enzyme [Streptococcus suis]|nr:aminotransferase class I/II-fold pyridoxal phosphate-dependent enzyme [Streptococcus suis]HEL9644395.1 aminotransferase class I/II-fold pyridoxal phosphate-dependent enzyme [Streptococcus suis]
MVEFRKEFETAEPYKFAGQATYNLGDNENRLIDWSFLAEETLKSMETSELTFYGNNCYTDLLAAYANYAKVKPEQVTVGVGSDFLIHMIITTFLKSDDVFLTVNPDFFMYQVYNTMHGSQFERVDLDWENGSLSLSADKVLTHAQTVGAKVIMLSNPNNPASVAHDPQELEKIITNFSGLVVIDEAYIEFAACPSFVEKINDYDNLIVLRTLSKAFGLAGVRLGFALANERLIYEIDKVIPPYSLSNLAARVGTVALSHTEQVRACIKDIKELRQDFLVFLESLPEVQVLPSQASFVAFTAPWAAQLHQEATSSGWNFKYYTEGRLNNYIRMAIGRPEEMDLMKKMIEKLVGA